MFGGRNYIGGKSFAKIAAFNTIKKRWEKSGELKYARGGHRVIIHQDAFVVVGGRVLDDLGTQTVGVHSLLACTLILFVFPL